MTIQKVSKTNSPGNIIIIVADLGRMRAFRFNQGIRNRRPQLQSLVDEATEVAHHLSDDMVVQPGKFTRGSAGTGGGSDGQEHNLSLERRHRALKQLAKNIAGLLRREKADECYLAIDRQINESLLAELPPATRALVRKNICANLSGLNPTAIVKRFAQAEARGADESPNGPRAKAKDKSPTTKSRVINKSLDRRFTLRNQRPAVESSVNRGKSLMDLPDTRRRRPARKGRTGPRRTQLGQPLQQSELAKRDPARED
jgi:hypothetical protein